VMRGDSLQEGTLGLRLEEGEMIGEHGGVDTRMVTSLFVFDLKAIKVLGLSVAVMVSVSPSSIDELLVLRVIGVSVLLMPMK